MMNRLRHVIGAALILIIASCAAPPVKKEEVVFYPPAPELPRLQYLTSFSSSKDIEEEKSAFEQFVVGQTVPRSMTKPYGVGIYDGKIYVCDTGVGVTVLDLKGKTFGVLKGARGRGKLIQPVNISIEADGTKYVTDPVRGQVVAFDRKDEYLRAYGLREQWRPVSAAAFEDRLYVVDAKNGAIRVFDKKSGEIVKTFGNTDDPKERLLLPTNMVFDKDGDLYVADVKRFQIVRFDRDGHFKSAFGQAGDNLGQFARPRGLALDREGHLYVADAAFNNVQIFTKEGRLVMFFGDLGDRPGQLILPAQVIVDYDNMEYFRKYVQPSFEMESLVIVTSQMGSHMVSVFALGKEKGQKYPTDEEIMKSLGELKQKAFKRLEKEVPGVEEKDIGRDDTTGGTAGTPERN
jgi:sugar lactone lactonase YvrE